MGNQTSVMHGETNVFEQELKRLNTIVKGIMTEENVFRNRDYNFLSQDVCEQHYMLAESDLSRHLKVHVKELGETLVLVPKTATALEGRASVNKKEICQKITHHYMKVLYILCLVKYVYNLEKSGDYSISGIVLRNIRVVPGDLLEVNFCNAPHRDFKKQGAESYNIDFGQLEGLQFLTQYFLDPVEGHSFLRILRQVLGRHKSGRVRGAICKYMEGNKNAEYNKALEDMFVARFGEKLGCGSAQAEASSAPKGRPQLLLQVEKDNPVFSKDYCYEIHKIIVPLKTAEGAKVLELYKTMKRHYADNVKKIEALVDRMVVATKGGDYELRDLTKPELDAVIEAVKKHIQHYYLQSILDFQILLDACKKVPNVNLSKT